MGHIKLIKGDITKQKVDAIVNPANTTLLGGEGLDGQIHEAAGPELHEACRKLRGCPMGKAKLTKGFRLPAKYIIHTVGPVWDGGDNHEEKFLANCYKRSLVLAQHHELKTVAFPAISTGVYNFPKEKAAQIAIREVKKFLLNDNVINNVYFVLIDDENLAIYKRLLKETE